MGKVKLPLEVIGNLRSFADRLQAVAEAGADNGAAEEGRTNAQPVVVCFATEIQLTCALFSNPEKSD